MSLSAECMTAKPHLVIQQEGESTENGNIWKQ